jgi:hypothetical protein
MQLGKLAALELGATNIKSGSMLAAWASSQGIAVATRTYLS